MKRELASGLALHQESVGKLDPISEHQLRELQVLKTRDHKLTIYRYVYFAVALLLAPSLAHADYDRLDLRLASENEIHQISFCSRLSDGSAFPTHAFVVFSRWDRTGERTFMRATGWTPAQGSKYTIDAVPGMFGDELTTDRSQDCLPVLVDKNDWDRALATANEYTLIDTSQTNVPATPLVFSVYRLIQADCITYAQVVAEMIGLKVPSRGVARPIAYVRMLAEANKKDNPQTTISDEVIFNTLRFEILEEIHTECFSGRENYVELQCTPKGQELIDDLTGVMLGTSENLALSSSQLSLGSQRNSFVASNSIDELSIGNTSVSAALDVLGYPSRANEAGAAASALSSLSSLLGVADGGYDINRNLARILGLNTAEIDEFARGVVLETLGPEALDLLNRVDPSDLDDAANILGRILAGDAESLLNSEVVYQAGFQLLERNYTEYSSEIDIAKSIVGLATGDISEERIFDATFKLLGASKFTGAALETGSMTPLGAISNLNPYSAGILAAMSFAQERGNHREVMEKLNEIQATLEVVQEDIREIKVQVNLIRNELSALRQLSEQEFGRINDKLDALSDLIETGFEDLSEQQRRTFDLVASNFEAIERQLRMMDGDESLRDYQEVLGDFRRMHKRCVDYAEGPRHSPDTFRVCLSHFSDYALEVSYEAALSGSRREITLKDARSQLPEDIPISRMMGALPSVISALGGDATIQRLPNSVEWTRGASAIIEMAFLASEDWERNYLRHELRNIVADGKDIEVEFDRVLNHSLNHGSEFRSIGRLLWEFRDEFNESNFLENPKNGWQIFGGITELLPVQDIVHNDCEHLVTLDSYATSFSPNIEYYDAGLCPGLVDAVIGYGVGEIISIEDLTDYEFKDLSSARLYRLSIKLSDGQTVRISTEQHPWYDHYMPVPEPGLTESDEGIRTIANAIFSFRQEKQTEYNRQLLDYIRTNREDVSVWEGVSRLRRILLDLKVRNLGLYDTQASFLNSVENRNIETREQLLASIQDGSLARLNLSPTSTTSSVWAFIETDSNPSAEPTSDWCSSSPPRRCGDNGLLSVQKVVSAAEALLAAGF